MIERSIDEGPLTPGALAYTRRWPDLTSALHAAYGTGNDQTVREHESEFDFLIRWALMDVGPRPYAFAPIRTQPQRTYDPGAKAPDPEGRHIPMVLAVSSDALPDFSERMEEFGKASGLYSSLSVRKLGPDGSDPFQIEVELPGGGGARNLIDVGYGVSQAIPIIVDCVSAPFGATLLIQQPEVHLHPRAQAAMGSFFGQLAASGRNRLVVETHSDYLIDRVRMDVRDEQIKASDVMILYFEQVKGGVKIHPIEIDASGNHQRRARGLPKILPRRAAPLPRRRLRCAPSSMPTWLAASSANHPTLNSSLSGSASTTERASWSSGAACVTNSKRSAGLPSKSGYGRKRVSSDSSHPRKSRPRPQASRAQACVRPTTSTSSRSHASQERVSCAQRIRICTPTSAIAT